jgi:hypothetical protein|mmetsp:Transcript_74712/g.125890  ORF Transcript_74712/g.125890 Transcript_74712/m.125890 type:complete len:89 (+) Transcript_74712:125-391(+)
MWCLVVFGLVLVTPNDRRCAEMPPLMIPESEPNATQPPHVCKQKGQAHRHRSPRAGQLAALLFSNAVAGFVTFILGLRALAGFLGRLA